MIIQRIFQRHTQCIVRKIPKVSVDHFQNVLKHKKQIRNNILRKCGNALFVVILSSLTSVLLLTLEVLMNA